MRMITIMTQQDLAEFQWLQMMLKREEERIRWLEWKGEEKVSKS